MGPQGEGDSRWLVTDRADGQNVGAWHWEEVNKMQWSRERLKELLVGIKTEMDPSIGHVALLELKEVQGEVSTVSFLSSCYQGTNTAPQPMRNVETRWLRYQAFIHYLTKLTAEGYQSKDTVCCVTQSGN